MRLAEFIPISSEQERSFSPLWAQKPVIDRGLLKLEAFGLWFQDRDDVFAGTLQNETLTGTPGVK